MTKYALPADRSAVARRLASACTELIEAIHCADTDTLGAASELAPGSRDDVFAGSLPVMCRVTERAFALPKYPDHVDPDTMLFGEAFRDPTRVLAPWRDMASSVYIVQSYGKGPIKIGHSRRVRARIAELQTAHPAPISLHASCLGGEPLERVLHHAAPAHRLSGEWFRPTTPVLLMALAARAIALHDEWREAHRRKASP